MWGQDYVPKLVTLTKKFSMVKGGADPAMKIMEETKNLK